MATGAIRGGKPAKAVSAWRAAVARLPWVASVEARKRWPDTLVLQVREAEIRKFRSLSASMCLAQALVISYAFEADAGHGKPAAGKRAKK